jgi:hypothetical protein
MRTSQVEMEVPDAVDLVVTDDALTVELSDARSISVPLAWFPRLVRGRADERNDWRLIGGGEGLHWDALNEDISVEGLLAGRRSAESQASLKHWLNSRSV